jgi:hypothetical protein
MDNNFPHYLTGRERVELMAKIQRLEWLLKECIGLEEYELCGQIQTIIKTKYELLETNNKTSKEDTE